MRKPIILLKQRSILIVIGALLYCSLYPDLVSAADNGQTIITDISNPKFNMKNMVPGDSLKRTVTIRNSGEQSFHYYFYIHKINSTKKLYENLFIQLESDSEILYEGQLKDNHQFTKLFLSGGDSERIHITVRMPEELGNEFQGSEALIKSGFMGEKELIGGNHITPSEGESGGIPISNHVSNHYEAMLVGIFFTFTGWGLLSVYHSKKGE